MTQVSYEFVAAGQDAVLAAFKQIGKGADSTSDRVERAAERQRQAQERAASKAATGIAREEAKRVRDSERASLQVVRSFERQETARVRAAARANAQIQRDRERTIEQLGSQLTNAALTAGALALGTVGAAAREVLQTQSIANRVSINARKAGGEAVDPTTLRKEFESAAIATPGQKAQDIGEATQKYVDLTGDLATARSSMKDFATVASATGASVQDVATAAAAMGKQFDVKKVEDMRQVMAILTEQGKGGALTMKDLAAQMQKLAAAGRAFGVGEGVSGLTKIGGLMQIAREGTRSPQQAGTAVENIFSGLSNKQKALAKIGVQTYDKSGRRKDVNELLPEIISRSGKLGPAGQDKELFDIFGKQGSRGINPLIGVARDASHAAGGGAAGEKAAYEAVAEALKKAEAAATSWAEVMKDATQAQQDTGAQLTAAWEKIKAQVGDQVVPKLIEMVPALVKVIGATAPLITAIGWVTTKLAGFADFLISKGLLTETTEGNRVTSHRNNAAASIKELAEFEGQTDSMNMTREQVEKRKALHQKIDQEIEAARVQVVRGEAEQGALLAGKSQEEATAAGDKAIDDDSKKGSGDAEKAAKRVAESHNEAASAADKLAASLQNAADQASRTLPLNKR